MQLESFSLPALALVAVTAFALPGIAMAEGMGNAGGPGLGSIPGFNFAEVDSDKDGKVTLVEVEAFHAARIKVADTDGDGKLSTEELAAMQLAQMTARANARATWMMERMDADKDGVLTVTELSAGPGPDAGRIFDMIDVDNDGAITQAEADAAKDRMRNHRGGKGGHGHGDRGNGKGGHGRGGNCVMNDDAGN